MAKKKNKAVDGGDGRLVVATNKKARRDYEIFDKFEAGIVLRGSEVKSIRAGNINLKESYVRVKDSEVFLIGCHISPYSHSPVDSHEPLRERKLLMHRREIERLWATQREKGLTLVPLQAYFRNGRCKVEIGVGRGKKLYDKREDMKAKVAAREMARAMKR